MTTTPKHSGLSRLADTALEIEAERARADGEQILHSYPVKKRGERRRLQPNQAGIAWLESDANNFDDDTTIDEWRKSAERDDGLLYFSTVGAVNHTYARPMLQILGRDAFHTAPQEIDGSDTCCYQFHRSWNCEHHPEVPYDHDRKVWMNPAQRRADSDRAVAERGVAASGFACFQEMYTQLENATRYQCPCGCGSTTEAPASITDRVQRFNPRTNQYEPDHSMEVISTDGLHNQATLRPVLGTPYSQVAGAASYWTVVLEAETDQSRGFPQSIAIEVERGR